MIFTGPYSSGRKAALQNLGLLKKRERRDAAREGRAMRWSDGSSVPEGVPVGRHVGHGRACDPVIGVATAAAIAIEDNGEWYVEAREDDKDLPSGDERVGGVDVTVKRQGREVEKIANKARGRN